MRWIGSGHMLKHLRREQTWNQKKTVITETSAAHTENSSNETFVDNFKESQCIFFYDERGKKCFQHRVNRSSSLWTDISKPPNVSLLLLGNHLCIMMSSSLQIQNTPCLSITVFLEGSTVVITWLRAHMTQTSLREELSVDVFKSFLVDDSTGTFLKDREEMHV